MDNVVQLRSREKGAPGRCCNPGCDFIAQDPADWAMGLDFPRSPRNKMGSQDSGRHVCPECAELQPSSEFGQMVWFDPNEGLLARIPTEKLVEVLTTIEPPRNGASFNLGTALLNAVREDLLGYIRGLGVLVFPADAREIEQQYGTLEEAEELFAS